MVKKLNEIWFGLYKLRVKMADRPQKQFSRQPKVPDVENVMRKKSSMTRLVQLGQSYAKAIVGKMPRLQCDENKEDGSSEKKNVQEKMVGCIQEPDEEIIIDFVPTEEETQWLEGGMVAVLKSLMSLTSMQEKKGCGWRPIDGESLENSRRDGDFGHYKENRMVNDNGLLKDNGLLNDNGLVDVNRSSVNVIEISFSKKPKDSSLKDVSRDEERKAADLSSKRHRKVAECYREEVVEVWKKQADWAKGSESLFDGCIAYRNLVIQWEINMQEVKKIISIEGRPGMQFEGTEKEVESKLFKLEERDHIKRQNWGLGSMEEEGVGKFSMGRKTRFSISTGDQIGRDEGGRWLLARDFNVVSCIEERRGRTRERADMKDFDVFIETAGLVAIKLANRKFTWYRPNGTAMSRLDRILITVEMSNMGGEWVQQGLKRTISDHCAIVLKTRATYWGPKPFRVLDAWQHHPEFRKVVEDKWNEIVMDGFAGYKCLQKLKLLKQFLKGWNKEVFGDIKAQFQHAVNTVTQLDMKNEKVALEEEELEERQQGFHALWDIMRKREAIWKQKSRSNWAKWGDANTRFFHKIANGRKAHNNIAGPLCDGRWIKEPEVMTTWLERPFSMEEIEEGLKSYEGTKALGSNGYNFSFIKYTWSCMKKDFVRFFEEFHQNGRWIKRATSVLHCGVGEIPFMYLGMPIGGKNGSNKMWDLVLHKFQAKLAIWNLKNMLVKGFRWVVGDGSPVGFWKAVWVGEKILRDLCPRLFQLAVHKYGLVSEMGVWEEGSWKWNIAWRRGRQGRERD
ncbi:hypothetical protein SLEP1_g43564 [Rubroshorea leprosula]|uniref:Reverse transcriptase n=1 Tax=Rubroshorea leprosula TaxID=152421 RepID=A0AAV5LDD6_9ROSI|nr:hypothetical protein SLEP1_g43564 [Rubroshorea leprosula]